MEVDAPVYVRFSSMVLRDFAAKMAVYRLDAPVLTSDVSPSQRPCIQILDEIEIANSCEKQGDRGLQLKCMFGGFDWDNDLEELLLKLAALEVEAIATITTDDDGDKDFWRVTLG